MGLAGQDVAGVQVGLAEREVLVHLDGPVDELRPAGAAGAAHARVGRVGADLQRRLEDRVAGVEVDASPRVPESVNVTCAAW